MSAVRSLKCDECPKRFSVADLDAEDPQAWGHPCDVNHGSLSGVIAVPMCESHRSPQIEYLPTVDCPICEAAVCVRIDGTFVPHLRAGQAAPCGGSNTRAPIIATPPPDAVDGQGSLF